MTKHHDPRAHIDYAEGGVTCAAIEKEDDEKPTAYWEGIYRAYRDDADNAHTMAALWKETAREHIGRAEVYKEWMYAAHEKAKCHDCIRDAAVIEKPLTADDITDEMVERALKAYYVSTANERVDHLRDVLTAALIEPPKRPEGAEDLEVTIIDTLGAGRLTDDEVATLADALATEENW